MNFKPPPVSGKGKQRESQEIDLSVIIVNWRSAVLLRECLSSLYGTVHGLRFEVIVIDNASFDGCGEMLAREFKSVRFIQNRVNMGFAAANNFAINSSRGRNLLFLNPDAFVRVGAVERLYRHLEGTADAGAVGGRMVDGQGRLRVESIMSFPTIAGNILDARCLRKFFPRCRLWGAGDLFNRIAEAAPVDVICGACLMVKRIAFEQVGRFSTDFFMYCEDVELCYKLRGAGLRNYLVPGVTVVHLGGSSSSKNEDSCLGDLLMRTSMWRYFRKVRGPIYASLYRASIALVSCLRLLLASIAIAAAPAFGGRAIWRAVLRKWKVILFWSIGLARKAEPDHFTQRRDDAAVSWSSAAPAEGESPASGYV